MAEQAHTQTCTYLKITRPNICSCHCPCTILQAVRFVLDNAGFQQLKEVRDSLIFRFVRPLPPVPFAWNPNNVGPLYFLVVLTLGVLIPSLR